FIRNMRCWICSQIGAREHYSIPRAIRQDGVLDRLVTDLWFSSPQRVLLKRCGTLGRRLAARWHRELNSANVSSFPFEGIRWATAARRKHGAQLYQFFAEQGEWFGKQTAKFIRKAPPDSLFFSYDTGFLEAGETAAERGIPTIVCQMDPGRVEIDLVREEAAAWPGWEGEYHQALPPDAFHERRENEWTVADRVMCNSEWTRTALIEQGLDAAKIVVVPLSFESPRTNWCRPEKPNDEPLEVLWLGSVILRKGIQYLLEACRQLLDENVRVTVVGSIGITEKALKTAPSNVTFTGPKPRSEVVEVYRHADVFVLPTISDGFAITQLEAMAFGLPVIATPNCGAVVSDGEDGFIVPARDSKSLAARIGEFANDRDLLRRMSGAAQQTADKFGIERLSRELSQLEKDLCG
ncbi:MAG: glycosyltransferase family 4 protein, partial [Verrucomicrobiota bacterium]